MENNKYFNLHLYVYGSVQGVGFRFFTIRRARIYNITGWVRNTYDGRVEIEAEGNKANLLLFLKDIKEGPRTAFVSSVNEEWHEIAFNRYKSFGINY